MDRFIKVLILLLFLLVVFGRPYFPSAGLYWSAYFLMFVLVAILWVAMFWVTRRKNEQVLGRAPDFSFFVGRVLPDVREDLQRGQLSFLDGKINLVSRTKEGVRIVWSAGIPDVRSVGFGKVAGLRKGFTLHFDDCQVPFASSRLFRNRRLLYNALGWEVEEEG